MQEALGHIKPNYTNKETDPINNEIQLKINELRTNTPTINTTTTYQDIINQFKAIANNYLSGTPTPNVKGFATQINGVLDQFQSQIQGQVPLAQQQNNPGTATYVGTNIANGVIPVGGFIPVGGINTNLRQKNNWSPKIVDKKN